MRLAAVAIAAAAAGAAGGAQTTPSPTLRPNSRLPIAEIRKHIDRQWVEDAATKGLLDYWVKHSIEPNGFIQENLDQQWKPWGTQREATINGQGRQLRRWRGVRDLEIQGVPGRAHPRHGLPHEDEGSRVRRLLRSRRGGPEGDHREQDGLQQLRPVLPGARRARDQRKEIPRRRDGAVSRDARQDARRSVHRVRVLLARLHDAGGRGGFGGGRGNPADGGRGGRGGPPAPTTAGSPPRQAPGRAGGTAAPAAGGADAPAPAPGGIGARAARDQPAHVRGAARPL